MTAIPNNKKIRKEQIRGVVKSIQEGSNISVDNTDPENPIISASGGGGGDVYKAGNNAFTGENSFANVPTSDEDAVEDDELVRKGQILRVTQYDPSDFSDITLTDSNANVTYSFTKSISRLDYPELGMRAMRILFTDIASTGSPSGGRFQIDGYDFYSFIMSNFMYVNINVKSMWNLSWTSDQIGRISVHIPSTGYIAFQQVHDQNYLPAFTCTNGRIEIYINCGPLT